MFTSNESARAMACLLLCLAALSLIVAACNPASTATQPPTSAPTIEPAGEPTPVVSHPNASGGFVDLVDALSERGATVELGENVAQPFFSVPGRSIKVNGAGVQVFEYDDAAARESESATISQDGATIGTTMVTWIGRPNFWARDRVIVLYVGGDADAIARLTEVLGAPITRSAASPTPQALTVHTHDTRVGVPEVDAVIEAALANDLDALRELVHYTTTGCTHTMGLGGPPKCEADETEGTLVEVFPILGPEGGHVRRAGIDRVFPLGKKGLHAVYRVSEDAYEEDYWPAGEYGIVFASDPYPSVVTLLVDERGIVRIVYSEWSTDLLARQDVGELVLPPAGETK